MLNLTRSCWTWGYCFWSNVFLKLFTKNYYFLFGVINSKRTHCSTFCVSCFWRRNTKCVTWGEISCIFFFKFFFPMQQQTRECRHTIGKWVAAGSGLVIGSFTWGGLLSFSVLVPPSIYLSSERYCLL